MNRKENEAVVNRFLLSSLYFILGLCAIYFLYRFAQTATGSTLIFEKNLLLWLALIGLVCLVIAAIKKSVYYSVISGIAIVCFLGLHFYWPLITAIYNSNKELYNSLPIIFSRSYITYAGCAVLTIIFYIYECVRYGLNVRVKTK